MVMKEGEEGEIEKERREGGGGQKRESEEKNRERVV